MFRGIRIRRYSESKGVTKLSSWEYPIRTRMDGGSVLVSLGLPHYYYEVDARGSRGSNETLAQITPSRKSATSLLRGISALLICLNLP